MTATRLDPDALARLEDERDHLLRSLSDLEAEHDAGDLTDEEYVGLRDEYTARAAEVLRAIEEHRDVVASTPRRSRASIAWTVVGAVVVASLAGLVLARSFGTRGAGTGLTGTAGGTREVLAECQRLFGEPDEAVECYDRILGDVPDQLEALTYQGWALVRAGRAEEARANFDRVVELDPTYPDVYVFRAVERKDAGDFVAAQAELDRLAALDPPASLVDTMQSMGLDVEVALGLLPPAVADCWTKVARFGTELQRSPTTLAPGATPAGFDEVLGCFDQVLADAAPGSTEAVAARTFRAAAVYGIGAESYVAESLVALDEVLAALPNDATARVVRAALRVRSGDVVGTAEDVGVLRGLGRPSALVSGIEAALRADVEELVAPPTRPPTTSTSPP